MRRRPAATLARVELAWLRRGAPARTSKPKAHRGHHPHRRGSGPGRAAPVSCPAPGPCAWATASSSCTGVGHRFADGTELFDGIDLLLDPRERLGIVGPNGPASRRCSTSWPGGRADIGPARSRQHRRIGYYDQVGRQLDPGMRVRDAVTGGHREADWADAAARDVLVRRRRPVGADRSSSRAASAAASSCCSSCRSIRTSCCWTSRPTTWTSTPSVSSRTSSTSGRERWWSSATIGPSWSEPSPM